MEKLAANLSVSRARTETIDGEDYLVAPVTMIVPGILHGSQGPLLYGAETVASNYSEWNDVPVLLQHPADGGSGKRHDILLEQGLGTVRNAIIKEGKLKGDACIHVERLSQLDAATLRNLRDGRPIECSTGLGFDSEKAPDNAVHNGDSYTGVITHIYPDHLAILPDTVGACSIQDGCGVLVNKDVEPKGTTMSKTKELVDSLIENSCCWDGTDRETLEGFSEEKLKRLVENANKQDETKTALEAATAPWEDEGGNKFTHNEGAWTMEPAKKPEEKPEDKTVENATTVEPKAMTDEEWLAAAPETVREDLEFARNERAKQKQVLVGKIVANVKGDDQKKAMAEKFTEYTLNQLQDIAATIPEEKKPEPLFGGADPATSTVTNSTEGFAPFGSSPADYIAVE